MGLCFPKWTSPEFANRHPCNLVPWHHVAFEFLQQTSQEMFVLPWRLEQGWFWMPFHQVFVNRELYNTVAFCSLMLRLCTGQWHTLASYTIRRKKRDFTWSSFCLTDSKIARFVAYKADPHRVATQLQTILPTYQENPRIMFFTAICALRRLCFHIYRQLVCSYEHRIDRC